MCHVQVLVLLLASALVWHGGCDSPAEEETKKVVLLGNGFRVQGPGGGSLLDDMVAYHSQQHSAVVDAPLLMAAGQSGTRALKRESMHRCLT